MNFAALERDLEQAIAFDQKYERENCAKFRAVEQKVASYDEFRDLVMGSHLTPLNKKEKLVNPNIAQKNVIWNVFANKNVENLSHFSEKKQKKHFTEM